MTTLSLTGNHGRTITVKTGTLVNDAVTAGVKTGEKIVHAGAGAVKTVTGEVTKTAEELTAKLVSAGVKFKDAAGNVITPAVDELTKLVKNAATYCKGAVEGTVNQVKQLVNDASQFCIKLGKKGLSTLEQVALYLKNNGPSIVVTGPSVPRKPIHGGGTMQADGNNTVY